jgi:hypothetical protein
MSQSRTVDAAEFRRWMDPTVQELMAFTLAVDDVVSRPPAAYSQAMGELAAEEEYRRKSSWQNPISDSHMVGAMTLRAVADYVRTFAEAFNANRPPVYGHLVVARSALEASVVSAWLNEPNIAYLERVKRGMCELLYSANEVERLELPPSDRSVAAIKADATNFGWEARVDRGRPVVDGTKRPSVGDGITQLLVEDSQAKLGRLLWNRLSAVTHATWWGLQWVLDLPEDKPDSRFANVSMGTDSGEVALQAFCILKALRVAATQRITLWGWNDDEQWQAACHQAEVHEDSLFTHHRGALAQRQPGGQ